VDCLHNGLDLTNESKLIKSLDKYYTNLFIKINMITIKNQGNQEIDLILNSVRELRLKWQEFKERAVVDGAVENSSVNGGDVSSTDLKC
jgi:flagellin-specific chaperone FliS